MIFRLIVAVLLFRLITLGLYPLTDPTEGRYAEIGRLMMQLQDWITPRLSETVPFWGKPPLTFWATASSLYVFGENEFAARLPHFLMGVAVIWVLWGLMVRTVNARAAMLTAALITAAVVFYVSAGAVMTDMALTLGCVLAMRGFWLAMDETQPNRRREGYYFFIGLAIGLLSKGPLVLVVSLLPIGLWVLYRRQVFFMFKALPWIKGSALLLLIVLPWYILAEIRTPGFIEYFIIGEHIQRYLTPGWEGDLYATGRQRPYGTIWLFGLIAALPWTVILPVLAWRTWRGRSDPVAVSQPSQPSKAGWVPYLFLWAIIPMVFFTLSSNVLITYVLPVLVPLAALGGSWLVCLQNVPRVDRAVAAGLVLTALCSAGFIVYANTEEGQTLSARSASQACLLHAPDVQQIFLLRVSAESAAFYSRGRTRAVDDDAEVSQALQRNESLCLILSPSSLRTLPEATRSKLTDLGMHGKYAVLAIK